MRALKGLLTFYGLCCFAVFWWLEPTTIAGLLWQSLLLNLALWGILLVLLTIYVLIFDRDDSEDDKPKPFNSPKIIKIGSINVSYPLWRKLVTLTQSSESARSLIKQNHTKKPLESGDWCAEKAIEDLLRDRR